MTVHTDILIQYNLPVCLLFIISYSPRLCSVTCKTRTLRRYGQNIAGLGMKMERHCVFEETFCTILETFCIFHVIKFFESLWIFCAFHRTFCIFHKTFCALQQKFCEFQERFCVVQITNYAFQEIFLALLK